MSKTVFMSHPTAQGQTCFPSPISPEAGAAALLDLIYPLV